MGRHMVRVLGHSGRENDGGDEPDRRMEEESHPAGRTPKASTRESYNVTSPDIVLCEPSSCRQPFGPPWVTGWKKMHSLTLPPPLSLRRTTPHPFPYLGQVVSSKRSRSIAATTRYPTWCSVVSTACLISAALAVHCFSIASIAPLSFLAFPVLPSRSKCATILEACQLANKCSQTGTDENPQHRENAAAELENYGEP